MAVVIRHALVVTVRVTTKPVAVLGWVYLVFGFFLGGSAIMTLSSDEDLWWRVLESISLLHPMAFQLGPLVMYGPLFIQSPCPVASALLLPVLVTGARMHIADERSSLLAPRP